MIAIASVIFTLINKGALVPERSIVLINKRGLHARAATRLVNCCQPFKSTITVHREERQADARNIMSLLMLAAPCGTALTIKAVGQDADQALDAVERLVKGCFEEDG